MLHEPSHNCVVYLRLRLLGRLFVRTVPIAAFWSDVVRRAMVLAPILEQAGGNPVCRLLVRQIGAESRREVVVLRAWSLACFDRFTAKGAELMLGHVREVA